MLNASKWLYDSLYRFSTPRWDNGKIPPELVTLTATEGARGRALDLGCGTGAQALYLAQHGWSVVGVDLAPKAIELAREKVRRAGATVDLQVADVTRLEFLQDPFNLVVDVGCFHSLGAAARKRYAQNLARLTRPGSLFLLYGFDHHGAFGVSVTAEQVAQLFAPPFVVREVKPGTYLSGRVSLCYRLTRE